jgi:parallel beta-helix repeat protein
MKRILGIAVAAALAVAALAPVASAAQREDELRHVEKLAPGLWKVQPGGSIQAAVDAARPGDTVSVAAGIYHQSVAIMKNGITLRGAGPRLTVIKPPKRPQGQPCFKRFGSGVCVVGEIGAGGSIEARTSRVTVTSLGIRNFPAFGVFSFGSKGLKVRNTLTVANGEYGIARFDSVGGIIEGNVAKGDGEAGIYVGDSRPANVLITDNRVSNNLFGIFIRHASHVTITHNVGTSNCQGIFVLDDGQPGGASDITLKYNVMNANNDACPADQGPPFEGGGILLLGATDSTVAWNVVRHNRGSEFNSGGIVLMSASGITGGSDVENTTVTRNLAHGNSPDDIIWDGAGSGNTLTGNSCGSSQPTGLC